MGQEQFEISVPAADYDAMPGLAEEAMQDVVRRRCAMHGYKVVRTWVDREKHPEHGQVVVRRFIGEPING